MKKFLVTCNHYTSEIVAYLLSHPNSFPDPVHAAVQPPGEAPPAAVVRGAVGKGQEEDLPRAHLGHPLQEAKDVLLPGVEGPQDRVQEASLHQVYLVDQVIRST